MPRLRSASPTPCRICRSIQPREACCMFSSFPKVSVLLLAFVAVFGCTSAHAAQMRELRVCADPDNLPFSNRSLQGFENKIAASLSRDLKLPLVYQWQRMGRSFVRDFIEAGKCDILIGVPRDFNSMLTTHPYYRSAYVFVSRRDRQPSPMSLNDAALRHMKIGVQMLTENYTPP